VVVAQETCPIILYGAPRSGTTFLNRILNEHPDIFISGETRIFLWAHASLNRLTRDPVNLYLHRDEIVDHLRAQYPRMIRDFYCGLNPEARYWGDKAPHYVSRQALGCLDTIADLFPETRFIQIVRDGRDVVASLVRKRTRDGEPWTTFEGAHRTWTHALEIGCGFGRAQPPYRYFELRYEDLIRDEVGMARKLFDFLGIEIHPSVVDFCRRQREKRTPLSGPTRDLSGDAAASDWGTVLTPEEQLRSLEILGRHLIQFGYETEASLVEVYRAVAERRARAMVQPVGDAVSSTLPEDATVLVVDPTGGSLTSLAGRTVWPFPQTGDGACASPYLADGADAIAQLETLRAKGADFLLVPSTAFWWLDQCAELKQHLESRYRAVLRRDDAGLVFDLGQPTASTPTDQTEQRRAHREWLDRLHQATEEIATLVPPSESLILLDNDEWGLSDTVAGRSRVPFFESTGGQWGLPPDDGTAIRELEQRREAGTAFMVFGWPSFWWLDLYPGLHRYLRSSHLCVLENDRLVAFDLRS